MGLRTIAGAALHAARPPHLGGCRAAPRWGQYCLQAAEIRQAAWSTTAKPRISQITQIFFLLTLVTQARKFQAVFPAENAV
jgi:hypothetical protein